MNTLMRRVAVVTTFSQEGWNGYAEHMVASWVKHWPAQVDLYLYPDEKVPAPRVHNVRVVETSIKEKEVFLRRTRGNPEFNGRGGDGPDYNYRYDVVKFCHKPFALYHFMHNLAGLNSSHPYSAMVWLDADTITHAPVPWEVVQEKIAPPQFDIQFLGRCYKYTECGYLYFNLGSPPARDLLEAWVRYYTARTFRGEREWHDSYLFDQARAQLPFLNGNDLTGHLPRRKGAGHPFVNSFLGRYMDHYKGDSRKRTLAPRPNDLFIDHGDNPYWRKHVHANARRKRP